MKRNRANGGSVGAASRASRVAVGALIGLLAFVNTAISQPFRALLGAEQGRVYAIQTDGALRFYWYSPEDGGSTWLNASGPQIGNGWQTFEHVAYNGNGVLYAVTPDGRLLYYRDLARNGTFSWENGGSGVEIGLGRGWAGYKWILGDGDGILYAIDDDGVLWFYRHLTQDANANWAYGGAARPIGSGWNRFKRVVAGRNGVIYAIDWWGNLFYYRDLARDGTINWANGGVGLKLFDAVPAQNSFYADCPFVFSTGNGNLYAAQSDGQLNYYNVTVSGADPVWNNAGVSIGAGFTSELLEGYGWPLSAAAGETIAFSVSGRGRSDVTFFRHTAGVSGVNSIPMGNGAFTPTVQPTNPEPWRNGCGWATSFTLTIPAAWPSGLYSARCRYGDGNECHVAFIVKPAARPTSCVAFIASVNTWLAYNPWGGQSHYSGDSELLSFLRPAPYTSPVAGGFHPEHLTRGDLWLLGFLESAGYKADVYTDIDFHHQALAAKYKCLVLGTHPEYWSVQMHTNLQQYLNGGGCLLYLGGNGIYEKVDYAPGANAITFYPRHAHAVEALFRNLDPPLPERAILGVGLERCGEAAAPYAVQRPDHPFFAGTGLTAGALIGTFGLNLGYPAACGLEVDSTDGPGVTSLAPFECASSANGPLPPGSPEPPAGLVVLATEDNADPAYRGADMIWYPHRPGGGFVFSVGSISFGGSLAIDAQLQQILRNALADACAPQPTIVSLEIASSTGVALKFQGRLGAQYALQSSPRLPGLEWSTEATFQLDTNVVRSVVVPFNGPQRFYRLMQAP